MSCWQIELIGVNAPDVYITDGHVYLDTDEDTQLRLSKRIEEMNDADEIQTDIAVPFDLPLTPKNLYFLQKYISPNVLDPQYTHLKARAISGSFVLRQTHLFVLTGSFPESRIVVEFRESDDHWLEALEKTYIKDLEWGTFELTHANLLDNWQNNNSYADGDQGVYFPLTHYGTFVKKGDIRPADFRPWIHPLKVLQDSFCKHGWTFKCDFLESTVGRKIIDYHLREDYGQSEALRAGREFKATGVNGDCGIAQFPNEIYDPGNNFDGERYRGVGTMNFILFGTLTFNSVTVTIPVLPYVVIQIVRRFFQGTETVIGEAEIHISDTSGGTGLINIESEAVNLLSEDQVFVRMSVVDGDEDNVDVTLSSTFLNAVKSTFYSEGETIEIAGELHPERTALEILKGQLHMFSGKVETDWVNREVRAYPDFDSVFFEDEVDGYFKKNATVHELQSIKQCDSEIISTPNLDLDRYCLLSFQDSGDEAIKELDLPKDNPLYSKTVDRGSQYREKTKKKENPLYEPTLNKVIQVASEDDGAIDVDVPHLWDNDSGELSYDIGPRTLIAHGFVNANKETPGGAFITGKIIWINQLDHYPYAAQFPNFRPSIGDFPYLIYGEGEFDLYQSFWRKALQFNMENLTVQLSALINSAHFSKFSFRDKFSFEVMGRLIFARMVEIAEFNPCEGLSSLVVLPQKQLTDQCGDGSEDIPCNNVPKFTVTKTGDCYNFNATGEFETNPEQIITEWRYFDQTAWTEASQVCNPDRPFYARARFIYPENSECEDQYVVRYIVPCDNNPELLVTYDYETDAVFIEIAGENDSELDPANSSITYQIDENDPVTVSGISLSLNLETGTICASGTASFTGSCPDIDLPEQCVEIPPDPPDCTQNNPGVECLDVGGNSVAFRRTGMLVAEPLIDEIQYREIGTEHWFTHDGYAYIGCPIEVRRVVIFCNDVCPPICTTPITCQCGCTQFNAGTPLTIAVCN